MLDVQRLGKLLDLFQRLNSDHKESLLAVGHATFDFESKEEFGKSGLFAIRVCSKHESSLQ